MSERIARVSRPARRAAIFVALAGLVVAVDATSGSAENDGSDGRDPDAVPGAPTDASDSPAVVDEGRDGGAAPAADLGRGAAVAVASDGPVDNGRGGVDPDVGPNKIVVESARSVSGDSGSVDTDSGLKPSRDADQARTAPSGPPSDQDEPGSTSGDAGRSSGADEGVVDRD